MFARLFRKLVLYCIFVLCIISMPVYAADNTAPSGIFENKACMECHKKNNSQLINDWRSSSHARTQPATDCVACHGKLHQDVASSSRRDSTCISCHGGKKDPVVHSYATSKHGVLMTLEKKYYDWNQPLADGNYRAPGCSYCHMHKAGHNVNKGIRDDLMDKAAAKKIQDQTRSACQDCHAPRYIMRLFDNGERMLEIGRKKVREARSLIERVSVKFSDDELAPARAQLLKMQQHLKNVYLGVAHQSPDYQWWHGHPALDGDLLRIKGFIGELYRIKK